MKVKVCVVFFAVSFLLAMMVQTPVKAQITYPSPYWDYSPITPRVGDVVTFDASDFEKQWNEKGESTIVSLAWNFGDGSSASGAVVNHTFANQGTYSAGVTATDNRGYSGTSEMSIVVGRRHPSLDKKSQ